MRINRLNYGLLLAFLLIYFLFLSFSVLNGPFEIDKIINAFIHPLTNEGGKLFFVFIAWLGDAYGVSLVSIFVLLFFYFRRKILELIIFFVTMGFGVGSSTLIKHLVQRVRPENMIIEYSGYSFPSGHSTMAILFYGFLFYFIINIIKSRTAKIVIGMVFLIFSFLILFSRIYLCVHWLSDVIGGILLGSFWLIIGILAYKSFKSE